VLVGIAVDRVVAAAVVGWNACVLVIVIIIDDDEMISNTIDRIDFVGVILSLEKNSITVLSEVN
jgi:hypothetical protein